MMPQDSQIRIDALADSLRRELNQTIEQLIECARNLGPPYSGESLLHLEWFARFALETQFAPALLAAATAVRSQESTERANTSTEDDPRIEAPRGLVARIQTRPILEMDSEFELYMFDKYKEMLPGTTASTSDVVSRERLAASRFDEKMTEFHGVDN